MDTAAACEIASLLEELLSTVISRTSPRDACRAAAVSPTFRAAADSDAVWSTFLPRDLPTLTLSDGELSPAPLSKKGLFLRVSDRPLLLPDRLMIMWLDRATGAKCFMLSARALLIVWGDTPQYWRWIPLADSRFSEGVELMAVCQLAIHGRIHSKMLSQNTTYATHMVFKIADEFYGLDSPVLEASVSIGGSKSTRQVCLKGYDNEDEDGNSSQVCLQGYDNEHEDGNSEVIENYWPMSPLLPQGPLPQKRADGWMELEMGEFYNEEGEDGEVFISLIGVEGDWKKGLLVQGIEIKPKKSG